MINGIKTFIEDNRSELIYVRFLIIILLVLAIPKWQIQHAMNIDNWDSYIYLDNGRAFAGMGYGDLPQIAPVVSFLLSLMFRFNGNVYAGAIIDLDVIMYVLGSIFFFILLRIKFDNNTSLIGTVIYSTFTLLYSVVGMGGTDVPGLTFTLLTIYLMVISHKYDTRLYYIAFPVAAFAFLSRYTAGIMIFSIIFYLLCNYIIYKNIDYKEIKTILKSILLGVICISPFLSYFLVFTGNPIPFFGQFTGTVRNTKVLDSGYLPDPWYYFTNLPNYLSSVLPKGAGSANLLVLKTNIPTILSWLLLFLMLIGILMVVYNIYVGVKRANIRNRNLTPRLNSTNDYVHYNARSEAVKHKNKSYKYVEMFFNRIDYELKVDYGLDELKLKGILKRFGLNRLRRVVENIDFCLKKFLKVFNAFNHTIGVKVFSTHRELKLSIFIVLLTALCLITTNKISYIITIAIWMFILLAITELFKDYEIDYFSYDLLMVSLFIVYVVFHCILTTKNDRYFITVLPFIAFFITNAISYIYSYLKSKKLRFDLTKIVSVFLIVIFVGSTLSFASTIPEDNRYVDIREACMWLQDYYPGLNDTIVVYSDNWPAVCWYLNVPAQRAILSNLSDEAINNQATMMLFRNETEVPASFFVDTNNKVKYDYPGFTKIKSFNDVTIYENTYLLEHNNKHKYLNSTAYEIYANDTMRNIDQTLINKTDL